MHNLQGHIYVIPQVKFNLPNFVSYSQVRYALADNWDLSTASMQELSQLCFASIILCSQESRFTAFLHESTQ